MAIKYTKRWSVSLIIKEIQIKPQHYITSYLSRFTAALFTIAKIQIQPKQLSVDEWVNKMCCIYDGAGCGMVPPQKSLSRALECLVFSPECAAGPGVCI